MSTPRYDHDCVSCTFLGNHTDDSLHVWDVYRSCDDSPREYLMRHGSEMDDYVAVVDMSALWGVCTKIEEGR